MKSPIKLTSQRHQADEQSVALDAIHLSAKSIAGCHWFTPWGPAAVPEFRIPRGGGFHRQILALIGGHVVHARGLAQLQRANIGHHAPAVVRLERARRSSAWRRIRW